MMDTEFPPQGVDDVNSLRNIVGEVLVWHENISESTNAQKMRSAIVKRVSDFKFDENSSSGRTVVELALDNGLLEWISYSTAVHEIEDTLKEKRLERYVAMVCHDCQKWGGGTDFLSRYPLLGDIWITSNDSNDPEGSTHIDIIKSHLKSLVGDRESGKDVMVGQVVVKFAPALDLFLRSPRMALFIVRDVYKCLTTKQWLAELIFDDGKVETVSLRSVRELYRITLKDGRIKQYLERLENDRILCQQQDPVINWETHPYLKAMAYGKDSDDLFVLLLNYLSKMSQEHPITDVISTDSDPVTNDNVDTATTSNSYNPVTSNTYSSQRIKKPRTSYADYITDDSAYFPKRVTTSSTEKSVKSGKRVVPSLNPQELTPLTGSLDDDDINHSNSVNATENTNIVYYQVSKGVLVLPDGSTYKCCAECHSHRIGVECCRLTNFHTNPSWDSSTTPVRMAIISRTNVYKRFEGAYSEPSKQSSSSSTNNPMHSKPVPIMRTTATTVEKREKNTKNNENLIKPPQPSQTNIFAKLSSSSTIGALYTERPTIHLSSKFQNIAANFSEIKAINDDDDASENDKQRLDKLEKLVLDMEKNFVDIMRKQAFLRSKYNGLTSPDDDDGLTEPISTSFQIFDTLKAKINQARTENADFISYFLPAELEVVRFWKLAESIKSESDLLCSYVDNKRDVQTPHTQSTAPADNVENLFEYVSQTISHTTDSLAQLLGVSCPTFNVNKHFMALRSMLHIADTRVQSISQLGEVVEIIQTGLVKNTNREEKYEKKSVYLRDALTLFESETNFAEKRRSDHAQRAAQEISVLQEEEKILLEKLQKVRNSLFKTRRKHDYQSRRDVTRCIKSKDGRDKTSYAYTQCSSLLNKAKQSRIIFSQFRTYVQHLVETFPLSDHVEYLQKISFVDRSSSSIYNDGSSLSASSSLLVPVAATASNETKFNHHDVNSKTIMKVDRLQLMRKVLEWITSCTQGTDLDDEHGNVSLYTLQGRRIAYEGIQIARNLLLQCKSDIRTTGTDTKSVVVPPTVVGDSLNSIVNHSDDKNRIINLDNADVTANFDNFLRECNPYEVGIKVEPSSLSSSNLSSKDVQVISTTVGLLAKPSLSPLSSRNKTLVLCDPRNLKHLSSKDMVERSLRIVRIMSRLVSLQSEHTHQQVKTMESKKIQQSLYCLSIMDNQTDIPSCFLDALTLTHSETYINFLKESCSAVEKKCKIFQSKSIIPTINAINSMKEIYASSTVATHPIPASVSDTSTEIRIDEASTRGIDVENKPPAGFIPMAFIKGASAGFDVEDDDTVSFDERDYVFQPLVPEEDDLIDDEEECPDTMAEGDMDEEELQGDSLDNHDGTEIGNSSTRLRHSGNLGLQHGMPLSSIAVLKSFDPLKYDIRSIPKSYVPSATSRIFLWDVHRLKRLGGYAAPFFKNFKDSLIRNPHFVIYTFQDGKLDALHTQLPLLQYLKNLINSPSDELKVDRERESEVEPPEDDENNDNESSNDEDANDELNGDSDDIQSSSQPADEVEDANEQANNENLAVVKGLPERVKETLRELTKDALSSVMEICNLPIHEDVADTASTTDADTTATAADTTATVTTGISTNTLRNKLIDYQPGPLDRVLLYDTMRRRRVGGNAAPYFRNLVDSLRRNTHFTIYAFQDNKCENLGNHVSILIYLKRKLDPNFDITTLTSRDVGDKSPRIDFNSDLFSSNKLPKIHDTNNKTNSGSSYDQPIPVYEPRQNQIYSQVLSRPGGTFFDELKPGVVTDGPGWWAEDHESDSCDTLVSPHSLEAALAAALVVCVAVDAVHSGQCRGFAAAQAVDNANDEADPNNTLEAPNTVEESNTQDEAVNLNIEDGDTDAEAQANVKAGSSDSDHVVRSSVYKESVGYVTWSTYALLLLDYAMKNNTANVPFKEIQIHDGRCVNVGRWLCDQRCAKRQNVMSSERLALMQKLVNRGKLWWDNPGVRKINNKTVSTEDLAFYNNLKTEVLASESVLNAPSLRKASSSLSKESTAVNDALYASENASPQLDHLETASLNSDDLAYYMAPTNTNLMTTVTDECHMQSSSAIENDDMTEADIEEVKDILNVFCCIRPPGHHAGRYGSTRGCTQNGFCLLNNVAIGAYYARVKYGYRRIAIVDIDAHFGNGTAEIFENDPEAFYASIHLQSDNEHHPFFPSSTCCLLGADTNEPNRVFVNVFPGMKSSSNAYGKRAGYNHFRLAFGMSSSNKQRRGRDGFREGFVDIIIPRLKAFRPDIIFLSSGFDGMYSDPIGGGLELQPEDFHFVTKQVCQVSKELCDGRVISVLEGGYDIKTKTDGLAIACEAHVKALMSE